MVTRIGTAGWAIDRQHATSFPTDGSALERYAAIFRTAEINSSFHRSHRHETWQRWREAVPSSFRFSVKMPKTISHERRLIGCDALLDVFVAEVAQLGDRLGVLLLQLPPSLALEPVVFANFIEHVRERCDAPVACEPRHPSFFSEDADCILQELMVTRVAADPTKADNGLAPGGWRGLTYYRLHGSPVIYRSSYADRLDEIAAQIRLEQAERDTWCIFDNTASSAALGDALSLLPKL